MKKITFLLAMIIISYSIQSQTSTRIPNYHANTLKSTNNFQITYIDSLYKIANYLSGPGVTISNVKFNGNGSAILGHQIGYYELNSPTPTFGVDTGIVISSGDVVGAMGPNNSPSTSIQTGGPSYSDSLLQSLVSWPVYDGAVIEFDFIPLTDTVIACKFVFASEEYPEYVNTAFNDIFGFFISGPNPLGGMFVNKNLALIPGDTLPISINTVNPTMNSQYYINNNGGPTLQYDGYTTPIMLQQAVTPGQLYHFRVGVTDVSDQVFDSGVFMKIKSFYGYASMPIANFSSVINGNMVTFSNTTNWAKYFVWDFGDGSTDSVFANNISITHVYSNNGSYDVKLEAHNYYQVNTILQTIQIGNTQGIHGAKGNTFEFIPSGAENTYLLNISLNQPQDVSILIADVSGKPVRTMLLKNQQEISHTFCLSGLAKGFYVLRVNTRENSFVRKVINK
ncbi:MAG: choice-of-anchor L domain-containing protein [Bacteroidota bacterium]